MPEYKPGIITDSDSGHAVFNAFLPCKRRNSLYDGNRTVKARVRRAPDDRRDAGLAANEIYVRFLRSARR